MLGLLQPQGDWQYAFSYHPMETVLDRADGIYLYDDRAAFLFFTRIRRLRPRKVDDPFKNDGSERMRLLFALLFW